MVRAVKFSKGKRVAFALADQHPDRPGRKARCRSPLLNVAADPCTEVSTLKIYDWRTFHLAEDATSSVAVRNGLQISRRDSSQRPQTSLNPIRLPQLVFNGAHDTLVGGRHVGREAADDIAIAVD